MDWIRFKLFHPKHESRAPFFLHWEVPEPFVRLVPPLFRSDRLKTDIGGGPGASCNGVTEGIVAWVADNAADIALGQFQFWNWVMLFSLHDSLMQQNKLHKGPSPILKELEKQHSLTWLWTIYCPFRIKWQKYFMYRMNYHPFGFKGYE